VLDIDHHAMVPANAAAVLCRIAQAPHARAWDSGTLRRDDQRHDSEPPVSTRPIEEPRDEPTDEASPIAAPHHDDGATEVPIVGIGASAGGLAAFEAFFDAMSVYPDPGIAFVLVQHLAPDHDSVLVDLVQRHTPMPVVEAADGIRVAANHVYVIPPNRDLAVMHGVLQLLEPSVPRGLRLPIDFFFRSLAQDQHERAIGIVLSGTGSDGTLGARAIKGEGGMMMAQSLATTGFDGMPRSVVASGLVDFVMAPAEMPARLMAFVARHAGGAGAAAAPLPADAAALTKVLVLLRAQTGHDFSLFKQRTVLRRIERRMAVHGLASLAEYARYMQETPTEAEALFADLLIGVTSFFRDPEAFAALDELVIAPLVDEVPAGGTVRVWTAGCSTGEEAYSIAMLLHEHLEARPRNIHLQCFATDIDRRAIDAARAGVYPANIAADVSAERLARFFVQDPADGSYRVQRALRDSMVFSEQDVIKDPPFSRVDLISCRNLLIYMGPELHDRLIPLFHYALNPGGVLFLGSAETVGKFGDLFTRIDRGAKLFRRRGVDAGALRPSMPSVLPPALRHRLTPAATRARDTSPDRRRELTEQALLKQGPAGALVNQRGDLLYLHGRTGAYLELPPGDADMNILTMAREGLRRDLTAALQDAAAQKVPVHRPGIVIRTQSGLSRVNLTVRPAEPAGRGGGDPGLFVVILEDVTSWDPAAGVLAPSEPGGDATASGAADARVEALREELRAKEAYLRTSNEELATSNEELKASNEELQSVNEELQSANEELETSKEELQSINEELATVNAELQTRMADLSRANNDLNNLLASTGMGTVFVDHALRIQRFTPAITQVMPLIQSDLGRPVGHLASNLIGYDSLVADIQGVLDVLTPREIEVQARSGAWFLLRIRPYRTLENVIEGAVVTFTDITDMKSAQAVLQESETLRRLAVVVRDSRDAILVQALDGRILAWNPGAERSYGWSEAEALTMNIRALVPEPDRDLALARVREVASGHEVAPYTARRLARDGRVIDVWLTAAALVDASGQSYAIATTERPMSAAQP